MKRIIICLLAILLLASLACKKTEAPAAQTPQSDPGTAAQRRRDRQRSHGPDRSPGLWPDHAGPDALHPPSARQTPRMTGTTKRSDIPGSGYRTFFYFYSQIQAK